MFKLFKNLILSEKSLIWRNTSYLTTQKTDRAACFSSCSLYFFFFYKMCTFSLHKRATADFRCTCIVLLLSYTGDSRAAFCMPLTSHVYTRIDTWFGFAKQCLQQASYIVHPLSHFLQQCHNEDWPISDSISLVLKYWHKLCGQYILNIIWMKGQYYILGT